MTIATVATFKILIVEDHHDWSDILQNHIHNALQMIDRDQNCEIKIVSTFSEASDALKETKWNLMVTDIGLGDSTQSPQKMGTQLIELASRKNIPSIAVSGTPPLTLQNVRDLLIKHGAYDFFSKAEFDPTDFIAKVQELLWFSETVDEMQYFLQIQMDEGVLIQDAQTKAAEKLADRARNNLELRNRLVKLVKFFGENVAKTFVSETIKRIFVLALKFLS
jgi:DNA-binding response OmpR family regulator